MYPKLILYLLFSLSLAIPAAAFAADNATTSKTPPLTAEQRKMLSVLINENQDGALRFTPVQGAAGWWAVLGSGGVIVNPDADVVAAGGRVIKLSSGLNLTETARLNERKLIYERLSHFNPIVFPGRESGADKTRIYVFTDITCPHCRNLHIRLPDYEDAGIEVAYLPFPRRGPDDMAADRMARIWCAKDPSRALDSAFLGRRVRDEDLARKPDECLKELRTVFGIGLLLGFNATPGILLPNGVIASGERSPEQILKMLGRTPDKGAADKAGIAREGR